MFSYPLDMMSMRDAMAAISLALSCVAAVTVCLTVVVIKPASFSQFQEPTSCFGDLGTEGPPSSWEMSSRSDAPDERLEDGEALPSTSASA